MSGTKESLEIGDHKFIECIVPDVNGTAKGKSVSRKEFEQSEIRIAEAIFGQDVLGNWCDDHDLIDIADVDMVLIPDMTTLVTQPWADGTAQCICDCQLLNGESLDLAPRSILKQIIGRFEDLGLRPVVAQEAEFYLVQSNQILYTRSGSRLVFLVEYPRVPGPFRWKRWPSMRRSLKPCISTLQRRELN